MPDMIFTPLPPLTPELRRLGISLRPRTDADADFLRDVYFAYRWEEVAQTGWPEPVRLAFLSDQHRLQRHHYDLHYADASFAVVEEHGRPIGRLYTLCSARDMRIVDIGLMPEARGRGLGGALLKAVLAQAPTLGATKISIHVEQNNPARRLYERLGFVKAGEANVYDRLELPLAPETVH